MAHGRRSPSFSNRGAHAPAFFVPLHRCGTAVQILAEDEAEADQGSPDEEGVVLELQLHLPAVKAVAPEGFSEVTVG